MIKKLKEICKKFKTKFIFNSKLNLVKKNKKKIKF